MKRRRAGFFDDEFYDINDSGIVPGNPDISDAALQDAQESRNKASKEIGKAKAAGDEEAAQSAIAEVAKRTLALPLLLTRFLKPIALRSYQAQ